MIFRKSLFSQLAILLIFLFSFSNKSEGKDLDDICRDATVLFEHRNFTGRHLEVKESIGNLELLDFGDKASSLCVPEGSGLVVYLNEGYCSSNFSITGPAKISNLKFVPGSDKSWNDSISSIRVITNKSENKPFGELVVNWAGVVDNGEETAPPHGPYGNIHVLVYEADQDCPEDEKFYPPSLNHIVLPGPISTGERCEWDDGDQKNFDSLGLFKWRSEDDKVLVFVYESDGKSHGKDWDHDSLFCEVVERDKTLNSKLYKSSYRARGDAVERAAKKNAGQWVKRFLVNDSELKKIYIELKTVPSALTYNSKTMDH